MSGCTAGGGGLATFSTGRLRKTAQCKCRDHMQKKLEDVVTGDFLFENAKRMEERKEVLLRLWSRR